MIRRLPALALLGCTMLLAQPAASSLSIERLLSSPFPDELVASPAGATLAWTFNERGVRNIYAADAPDFTARRITPSSV